MIKKDLCPKYSLNNLMKRWNRLSSDDHLNNAQSWKRMTSKESRRDWSRFREIDKLQVRTVGSHYVTKFDQSLCQTETELAIFHYISDHFILQIILITFGWKEYFKDISQS